MPMPRPSAAPGSLGGPLLSILPGSSGSARAVTPWGSVAPGSGPAPCLPEQYRPNPAIFAIAIGKLYTWPKDIGSIKRLGCRHRLAALLPLMVPMQMIASNNAGQW